MANKPVERRSEIKASITMINDKKTGHLVGFRLAFTPPAHSEEEHAIELALFGVPRTVSLNPVLHGQNLLEVGISVVDPLAVLEGQHTAENWRRKRDGKPSLEEEAAAKKAAAEAAAKEAEVEKANADARAHGFKDAAEMAAHVAAEAGKQKPQ